MKKLFCVLAAGAMSMVLSGCDTDARVASRNLSQAADNFEVTRRIVFYNGITGEYMLNIEGRCSIDNASTGKNSIAVTCKTGVGVFKKHFLGLSDNVTFFVEQMDPMPASTYHYRVFFKPQVILPNIEFKGSTTGN